MQPLPGRAPATSSSVATAPIDPRREKRINVAVPVKVFLDPNGAGCQLCCTYEISLVGARLVAVSGITEVGQTVWLQRHNKRAKYRVIWIGEPGTSNSGQVGVETLEPANVIWENELKIRIMQSR
ncbi:MAG: PilZ domain-containing protein [Acidobacteriia bacterium]|nr:PilZ domain-containing protein [Terriglobia bacterium]